MAVVTKAQLRQALVATKAIMDGLAGYIPEKRSVSLDVNNWGTDNNANYPQYYDLTIQGITTNDRVDVLFDEALLDTVSNCGISPVTTVTAANTLRIRAMTAPTVALTGTAWIIYGKENV